MASVLDLVKHYQHAIEKYSNDANKTLKSIDKLFSLDVTVQHLQETGVGRTVNALRKEPGDVGQAARALVYKWKLMVAAEESDQDGDRNTDTTTYNGHANGRDTDDIPKQSQSASNVQDKSPRVKTEHKAMNGDHSSNKRKYQSSEDEEPDSKKRKSSQHNDSKYDVKVKNESSESGSDDYSDQSQSEESDSEMSASEEEVKESKPKIKKEPPDTHNRKQSSHSHSSPHSNHKEHKRESSSSKKSYESEKHSKNHHTPNHTEKNSEKLSSKDKSHHTPKHKSSKESESSHKQSKSKHESSEKDKKEKVDSSTSKHTSSSSKSKSSHSESRSSDSEKHKKKDDKHSSRSDKSKNSSSSHKSDKEKHKSSAQKEVVEEKVKSKESKESSRSSKEKHSSSSNDRSKDRSSSSKEKSDSSKSEKKHSSSDKSKHSDSKHKSDKKVEGSEKTSKHSSSSKSSKSKSSSSKSKEDVPKKKVQLNTKTTDSDDGIDCGSGASFAEALGMISPAKPKKKEKSFLKDSISPNANDLSPAALLAPTAKLAPLPALEISALPEISPNYKPRPPPKLLPHFTDEEAMSAVISSKNQRTKVYSGNKVIGKIPTLYEMCVQILQEHIDALEYTGGVPYDILKPVVDKSTPDQLFVLEHFNPYLMDDTDHLWQKFCEKHFRSKQRQEMETWREMYLRCQEEQEHRLKSLTANIKMTQEAKKAPIKQTKMAYVDTIVKPPRNVQRKQALHGTAHAASASPAARVASLAAAPNVLRGNVRPTPSGSISTFQKPKKAPLMQKALQFMRGRKR